MIENQSSKSQTLPSFSPPSSESNLAFKTTQKISNEKQAAIKESLFEKIRCLKGIILSLENLFNEEEFNERKAELIVSSFHENTGKFVEIFGKFVISRQFVETLKNLQNYIESKKG